MSQLEQVIKDLEFENEHLIQQIKDEYHQADVMQKFMQEKNTENIKMENSIASLDKEAKALHDQFTQNKDVMESLKSATALMNAHLESLRRSHAAKMAEVERRRSEYENTIKLFTLKWQKFEEQYESLPLAREVRAVKLEAFAYEEEARTVAKEKMRLQSLLDEAIGLSRLAEEKSNAVRGIIYLASCRMETRNLRDKIIQKVKEKSDLECLLIKKEMEIKVASHQLKGILMKSAAGEERKVPSHNPMTTTATGSLLSVAAPPHGAGIADQQTANQPVALTSKVVKLPQVKLSLDRPVFQLRPPVVPVQSQLRPCLIPFSKSPYLNQTASPLVGRSFPLPRTPFFPRLQAPRFPTSLNTPAVPVQRSSAQLTSVLEEETQTRSKISPKSSFATVGALQSASAPCPVEMEVEKGETEDATKQHEIEVMEDESVKKSPRMTCADAFADSSVVIAPLGQPVKEVMAGTGIYEDSAASGDYPAMEQSGSPFMFSPGAHAQMLMKLKESPGNSFLRHGRPMYEQKSMEVDKPLTVESGDCGYTRGALVRPMVSVPASSENKGSFSPAAGRICFDSTGAVPSNAAYATDNLEKPDMEFDFGQGIGFESAFGLAHSDSDTHCSSMTGGFSFNSSAFVDNSCPLDLFASSERCKSESGAAMTPFNFSLDSSNTEVCSMAGNFGFNFGLSDEAPSTSDASNSFSFTF